MKFTFKNVFLYLFGLLIIGLGVITLERTKLGLGSWDAVNFSLKSLTNITLGTASIIVNAIILLFVIIYNKSFKYLSVIVAIVLGGLFIDFWDQIVFKNVTEFSNIYLRIGILATSIFILPFGLSLVIHSTLPKGIFDEATYSLMSLLKINNFGVVRIILECFAVVLALTLGYFAKIGWGQVGVGTIIVTFTIGPLINFYLTLYNKKTSQ